MNNLSSLLTNKYLALPICFLGGYTFNKVTIAINRLATKIGLPFDLLEGKEYKEWSAKNLDLEKVEFNKSLNKKLSFEDRLRGVLWTNAIGGIREEVSYRFLLETVVLPKISSKFAASSLNRTAISSLLFASSHLHNDLPKEILTVQFFNTIFLGVISSVAQEKFGFLASIFVHVGYNLNAWNYTYDQDGLNVLTKIKAVEFLTILNPRRIAGYIDGFLSDVVSPFALTYKVSYKAIDAFK